MCWVREISIKKVLPVKLSVMISILVCTSLLLLACSEAKPDPALNASSTVAALREEADAIRNTGYQGLDDVMLKDSFEVAEPYIVYADLSFQITMNQPPSYYLLKYSDGDSLDDDAVENAGTLVYADIAHAGSESYTGGTNNTTLSISAYCVHLFYYDIESAAIIGYEKIEAPPFPDELGSQFYFIRPSDEEIVEAVEARLTQ